MAHLLTLQVKECSVPCLLDIVELQEIIHRDGVQLSQEANEYLLYIIVKKLGPKKFHKLISKYVDDEVLEWKDDYEVESILNNCKNEQDGQMYYLIKWVGWGHEHNTWEPEKNLFCADLLEEYKRLTAKGYNRKRKLADTNQEDQFLSKTQKIDEFFQKFLNSRILDIMSPLDIIKCYSANKKKTKSNGKLSQFEPKYLRVKKRRVSKKLLQQEAVRALKIWQDELNKIIKGYDPAPLFVENTVDLEGPPEDFIYINERKEGPGVVIPKDPLIGCECNDCYENRKSCCAVVSGSVLAYYKSNGRLRVPRGVPIFECNMRCKCGPDCLNRVAQKGRRIKVCIFRTPNGRGWGVKTLQKVKKGAFVMEYVGEVITNEEAERRGKEYDAVGRTYLFDLDFHDDDAPFAVDAGTHGNAAHFINHSCNPNLEVHVVWINTLDPQLPHICLYAKRDIESNEELTFDYMSGNLLDEQTPSSSEADPDHAHDYKSVSGDQVINEHWTLMAESNSLQIAAATVESNGLPMADSKCSEMAVNHIGDGQIIQGFLGKEKNVSGDKAAEQMNGIMFNKWENLPTPSSDSQSLADENGNSLTRTSQRSYFSMACLCGASNCRKFLFF